MEKNKTGGIVKLIANSSAKVVLQKDLLRDLLDDTPMMIWLSGTDNRFNYFNNSWLEYTGRKLDQEIGYGWITGIHHDDIETYLDVYMKCFNDRKSFNIEYRLKKNDGAYRWLLTVGKPNIVDGVFMGYVGSCIDIEEQKDATRLLQETVERIQIVLDTLPNVAWRNTPEGKAVYSNPHWVGLTGQTTDELIKEGPLKYVHPDDYIKVDHLWALHSKSGEPLETEIRYLRASDKSYRWHLVRAVPVRNDKGEIISWISNGTDIHDQKQFSIELEQRVKERTKELMLANRNLERSNNDLQQFAFVASHDLQEPLRKISLYTGRLKSDYEKLLPPKAMYDMSRVINSSLSLMKMINDLLDFSKLGDFGNGFIQVDLNVVLKDVLKSFEEIISTGEANVNSDILPVVQAVPSQMNLLFHNLINNAFKFCPDNSVAELNISARILNREETVQLKLIDENQTYCELCFTDNGIGFDQEMAEQIFIIFQRLNSKEQFPGTGMGLTLCRKIVENHKGLIYAKSEKTKGSSFYVLLPLKHH